MAEPITRNAYAILGVSPECDDDEILTAYRALARRYHPDIAGEAATERMTRINAAFERLRTPERREEYDQELEASGVPRSRRARRAAPPPTTSDDPAAAPVARPAAPSWRHEPDGTGGAGRPPGRPSGSVLRFGRHLGWSIGEIARVDPGYLVWLEERREGQPHLEEIDRTLRATGYRVDREAAPQRGRRRR